MRYTERERERESVSPIIWMLIHIFFINQDLFPPEKLACHFINLCVGDMRRRERERQKEGAG